MPKVTQGKFATAINCVDGRVQLPVNEWMRRELGVDYVDTVTEPGPNGILANGFGPLVGAIKHCVVVSVNRHGSNTVAIVGHHDCAGNPGPREQQIEQLRIAAKTVEGFGLGVRVIGLYVGDAWKVEKVLDTKG